MVTEMAYRRDDGSIDPQWPGGTAPLEYRLDSIIHTTVRAMLEDEHSDLRVYIDERIEAELREIRDRLGLAPNDTFDATLVDSFHSDQVTPASSEGALGVFVDYLCDHGYLCDCPHGCQDYNRARDEADDLPIFAPYDPTMADDFEMDETERLSNER